MDEKGANNVVERAKRAFGFSVLRGSIWARETREYALLKEEVAVLKIIKFSTIVALDEADGKKEVGGCISLEIKKISVYVGFIA